MNAADEAARERPNADRIEDLAGELAALDDVSEVNRQGERTPERLAVVLDVANVTAPVEDLLDDYNAEVEPDSLAVTAEGTLSFDVTTPEGFKSAGQRPVRSHGTSLVVTLTREALDLSGFDEGDDMDLDARNGAILITPHGE